MEEPITLVEACKLYPRSRLTVSTLRAEAARRRLEIFRLGKRDYTTQQAMAEMVRRCREEDYRRDFYVDATRGEWVIRDGERFVRTGCAKLDRSGAETRLAAYLGQKHTPKRGPSPLIADILLAYATEHLPHTQASKNAAYNVGNLSKWWGDKKLSDVTARNCRAYAEGRTSAAARRDLEVLRAAIGHWHREYGPLPSVPSVVLPPKSDPRERWLTRSEAAHLLWAARRMPHLARFILLGIYTGSRSGTLLSLCWPWIDLTSGTMRRRAPGTAESKQKRTPPVRLGRRIIAHLRRWRRRDSNAVFVCHYNGQRIKSSWHTAVKAAGLGNDVTPHTLRHTRATWLMQDGVDPWEAAGHLGMSLEIVRLQMVWDNLSCLGTEALARLGLRLGGFQLMFQSSLSDGVAFDPFSFQKDGSASAEVDVGRCQVL